MNERPPGDIARLAARIAPAILIGLALLPAATLLALRFVPTLPVLSSAPVVQVLLVIVPVSAFLLAILLYRARTRLLSLEIMADHADEAGTDTLTGLPNRHYFEGLFERAVARANANAPAALLLIVVDKLDRLEESRGRATSDRLLRDVANRLRLVIQETDTLARVGIDRFALLLADADSLTQCAPMAHRMVNAMTSPFDIEGVTIGVALTIGIAVAPLDGPDADAVTEAAHLAVQRAKEEGFNSFAFHDKVLERRLRHDLAIEDDLRAAIASESLTILYQPLIRCSDERLCGVEALVRWQHPRLGLMAPDSFIPLAEARGLIADLGELVLRKACEDARRWKLLRVAVNVSPTQFRIAGFVERVCQIVAEAGMDPARLDLELTEGVLIRDEDQAEAIIIALRANGIRMGLDDFGAGYSSMIYLRRFAFNKIKIDKALLGCLEPHGESAIILQSIISLGHALGLTVTAEGVETQEQIDFLRALGCDELQGYVFAEPLTADAVEELVAQGGNARRFITAA